MKFAAHFWIALVLTLSIVEGAKEKKGPSVDLEYTNNFYILLSSSTFYFNYRHTGNTLIIYKYLKARGIHDDRILLMLPENHACNARNKYPGKIFVNTDHVENFYCDDVEVDYKSNDMNYEAILNLFRGRYDPNFPESKKLKTNSESKIFVYFNGHGGENFFKIQDTEVLQSEDFAKVYEEMHLKRMYNEILMFIDTCQAFSLFDQIKAPNLFLMGTSKHGQSAYSHQHDFDQNLELNDKFTYAFYQFLNGQYLKYTKKTKLSDLPDLFPFSKLDSHVSITHTHPTKTPSDLYLYEYIPLPETQIDGTTLYNLDDYPDINIL